ncbi:MAG: A24 family peptidase [Peptostreptococcaceae bacterium]
MIKIILISLLMVQVIQFSIKEIFKIELDKNKLVKIIYIIIPTLVFVLYVKLGFNEEFLRYSILICFLLVISIIDYYTMYIYDITIISGIIIQGFILLTTKDIIINHILGLIFGFIIPYIMVKLTKGVGSGDIGVYALCCFCIGIEKCIYMIPISFMIGGVYGVYLIVSRKKSKNSYMPFAPCIFLATLFVILSQQSFIV